MRYPSIVKTLLYSTLALLLLVTGPIACNQDDSEEAAAEIATTEDPAADAAPAPAIPLSPEEIPELVARLNGTDIYKDELLNYSAGLRQRLTQGGVNPGPPTAEFYRSALDQLMGGVLLYENAQSLGLEATEAEVTSQFDSMRSRFPSPEAFAEALASQGVTEESMRKDIRRGISVQKLIDGEVAPQITLAPDAERNYYDANLDQMQQPEQVHLRHILIRVDEGAAEATRKVARERADKLLAQIQAGEDFATLAQANSDDPGSAARGGDLSWIARGQTVPEFEQTAFAMQPGELSGVIESPFGYHIIRMEDRRDATTMEFDQVSEGIRQMLLRQAMEGAIDQRIATLRAGAEVEVFI